MGVCYDCRFNYFRLNLRLCLIVGDIEGLIIIIIMMIIKIIIIIIIIIIITIITIIIIITMKF